MEVEWLGVPLSMFVAHVITRVMLPVSFSFFLRENVTILITSNHYKESYGCNLGQNF
jgi:hypothetical protein